MVLSATDEVALVRLLGPALQQAGLSTKILVYDQNWDGPDYPAWILNDSSIAHFTVGVAWHCYSGEPSTMTMFHGLYPQTEQFVTECSTRISGMSTIALLLHSMQNWASAVALWNLVLDESGGPKIGQGCDGCTGLITAAKAGFRYTNDYYELAHFSRFVKPGAYRMSSTTTAGGLESVAFENADRSRVIVVYNVLSTVLTFKVKWDGDAFLYTIPAHGIVTFSW